MEIFNGLKWVHMSCADPESFVRGVQHEQRCFFCFFVVVFLDWMERGSKCRLWPTVECWLGSFVIFRGSGSILLGLPIFLGLLLGNPIFLGGFRGVRALCPPSGSAHVCFILWQRRRHRREKAYLRRINFFFGVSFRTYLGEHCAKSATKLHFLRDTCNFCMNFDLKIVSEYGQEIPQ